MDIATYDYKTIVVKKENKYRVLDAAEAFGYVVIETKDLPASVVINLKRDANLSCKDELNKKFDEVLSLINEVAKIETKKKNKALCTALTIGIVGILTFGGGMSSVMTQEGWKFMALGIVLGVIGIILMLINEPIYRSILVKSISKYEPIIADNINKINELLKEANNLIKKSME